MSNAVNRRQVRRNNDPFGIPACFYWTVDEVADWVESIGYGKYKENFRSHFINGRKLLTVDACVLPKLGIVHFGDILNLTKTIDCLSKRCKVSVTDEIRPGPPPIPFSIQKQLTSSKQQQTPWCEQKSHVTLIDFVSSFDRIQAAKLANQPQYYMGP